MRNIAVFALLGASFLLAPAAPADAQALRTWVSATGNDDNPCTVTAPCKTFALAYSRTATGGEINCLDPGGFGTLGIARSMTIDYLNTQGAILANNVNGISVHGAGVVVHLRGLSISGAGTGLVGVTFTQGARLYIDKCKISGFQGGTAQGVRFVPSTASARGSGLVWLDELCDRPE